MAKRTMTSLTGTLYCRPEKRGQGLLGKTSPRICPDCKFRIRTKNHKEGSHHKQGKTGVAPRRR
jgi:hypothetical protein